MKNKGVKLRDILYVTAIALVACALIYHLFFEEVIMGSISMIITMAGGAIGVIACLRDIIIDP